MPPDTYLPMCLNPIQRPNPNYGLKPGVGLNFTKDLTSKYIEVPCGHCPECVALRQNQLVQRVENEAKYSYLYFITLTYDNKHLPRYRVLVPTVAKDVRCVHSPESRIGDLVPLEPSQPDLFQVPDIENGDLLSRLDLSRFSSEDGVSPNQAEAFLSDEGFSTLDVDPFVKIPDNMEGVDTTDIYDAIDYKEVFMPYADIHHIQLLLKNLRDNQPVGDRRLRYVCVSELGKTRARPHFHILLFVERLPGDDKFTPLNLERPLREYVKAHWAVNVGTRKNPVWEPRFTYRKRYYGGKLYQNFDLHYVNPNATTEGVQNVAYYVTKYMMKPSPKEEARQQFLKLNLDEEQYESTWSRIKCRLLVSKGLGLDCTFETVEQVEYVPLPLDEYAKVLDADDLPPSVRPDATIKIRKKRLMIPNFELAQWIHNTMRKGLSEDNPHPIYVDLNGNRRPLARYYQNKFYIYTVTDYLDFWLNASQEQCHPKEHNYYKSKKMYEEHRKRLKAVDSKGDFDLLSTAMDSTLFGDVPPSGSRVRGFFNNTSAVYRIGTDKL